MAADRDAPAANLSLVVAGRRGLTISTQELCQSRIASQERFIVSLQPTMFRGGLDEWLNIVRVYWAEYCRDFLDPLYRNAGGVAGASIVKGDFVKGGIIEGGMGGDASSVDNDPTGSEDRYRSLIRNGTRNDPDAEPDIGEVVERAREATRTRISQDMVLCPDKSGWTAEDHMVRFLATTFSDGAHRNMWPERGRRHRHPKRTIRALHETAGYLRAGYMERLYQQLVRERGQGGGGLDGVAGLNVVHGMREIRNGGRGQGPRLQAGSASAGG